MSAVSNGFTDNNVVVYCRFNTEPEKKIEPGDSEEISDLNNTGDYWTFHAEDGQANKKPSYLKLFKIELHYPVKIEYDGRSRVHKWTITAGQKCPSINGKSRGQTNVNVEIGPKD